MGGGELVIMNWELAVLGGGCSDQKGRIRYRLIVIDFIIKYGRTKKPAVGRLH